MNKLANDILTLHNLLFDNKKKYENILDIINNENYQIFYEYENTTLIAYMIICNMYDSFDIYEIAVKEEYRLKGYANKLLEKLPIDFDIFLEVSELNEKAIKLYKKNRFEVISIRRRYYPDDSNAIIMKRSKE